MFFPSDQFNNLIISYFLVVWKFVFPRVCRSQFELFGTFTNPSIWNSSVCRVNPSRKKVNCPKPVRGLKGETFPCWGGELRGGSQRGLKSGLKRGWSPRGKNIACYNEWLAAIFSVWYLFLYGCKTLDFLLCEKSFLEEPLDVNLSPLELLCGFWELLKIWQNQTQWELICRRTDHSIWVF